MSRADCRAHRVCRLPSHRTVAVVDVIADAAAVTAAAVTVAVADVALVAVTV